MEGERRTPTLFSQCCFSPSPINNALLFNKSCLDGNCSDQSSCPSDTGASSSEKEEESPFPLVQTSLTTDATDLTIDNDVSFFGKLTNEQCRVETFTSSWPYLDYTNLAPPKMAKAGFFCLGKYDKVQCPYCTGILGDWLCDDDPLVEHYKHFPHCRFVFKVQKKNAILSPSLSSSQLQEIEDGASSDSNISSLGPEDGLEIHHRDVSLSQPRPYDAIKDSSISPKHPHFSPYDSRSISFSCWPKSSPISSADLCEAGFFYIGYNDYVKCFHCDGGLRNWQEGDIPWRQHAQWFPQCLFLKMNKGNAFIEEVLSSAPIDIGSKALEESKGESTSNCSTQNSLFPSDALLKEKLKEITNAELCKPSSQALLTLSVPMTRIRKAVSLFATSGITFIASEALLKAVKSQQTNPSTFDHIQDLNDELSVLPSTSCLLKEENENLKAERCCKICLEEKAEILFMPCRHLVACSQCSIFLKNCPICRSSIKGSIKAYLV